jgi:hypothetical protein
VHNQLNWLVFGDFNIMLSNDEKKGGNLIDPNITNNFRNILSLCNLQDLGYTGNTFTWTNRNQGEHLILARLDRFLATTEWKQMFPYYTNQHLLRYQSDHNPILLDFSSSANNKSNHAAPKLRKFEQVWTRNKQHITKVKEAWSHNNDHLAIKLQHTLNSPHQWGYNLFGNLPRQIKKTQEDLMHLNNSHGAVDLTQQIKSKEIELDNLLEGEEMWWQQRARTDWLQHGDKNTKFFDQKASQRRKKNRIKEILDNQGQKYTEHEDIERVLIKHFKDLFQNQETLQIQETVKVVED